MRMACLSAGTTPRAAPAANYLSQGFGREVGQMIGRPVYAAVGDTNV
jgi:hypothetical protein